MKMWIKVTIAIVIASFSLALVCQAASAEERKVKTQIQPLYPELAKAMHLSGTVKVEVTINQQGNVTNTKVLGGHPVLADSAVKAVQKWHFEAGNEEVRVISFDFKP